VGPIPLGSRSDRQGSDLVRFTEVRLRTDADRNADALVCGRPAVLELRFQNNTGKELQSLTVAVGIDNHYGQRILYLNTELVNQNFQSVPACASRVLVNIAQLPLAPGRYGFTLFATVNGTVADWIKNAGHFDVNEGDFYGTGRLPPAEQGSFLIPHCFQLGNESG
jgi:lipopolysaccharide transport system ATP-binding protein